MIGPASSGERGGTRIPECTITGDRGDDPLRGTVDRDVICALAGVDFVPGRLGNDLILLGPSEDGFNAWRKLNADGGDFVSRVENGPSLRGRLGASEGQPASPGSSGSRGSGTSRSSGVPGTLGSELAGSSVPMSTRVTFGKSRRAAPAP